MTVTVWVIQNYDVKFNLHVKGIGETLKHMFRNEINTFVKKD